MSIITKCCQQSTDDHQRSITCSVQLCGCDAMRCTVCWCQPRLVLKTVNEISLQPFDRFKWNFKHHFLLLYQIKLWKIIGTKLDSVSLCCKSHHYKAAKIKILPENSMHWTYDWPLIVSQLMTIDDHRQWVASHKCDSFYAFNLQTNFFTSCCFIAVDFASRRTGPGLF